MNRRTSRYGRPYPNSSFASSITLFVILLELAVVACIVPIAMHADPTQAFAAILRGV